MCHHNFEMGRCEIAKQAADSGMHSIHFDWLIADLNTNGIAWVSDYEAGQLDTLVHNMLTDDSVSYDCEELWFCLDAVAQNAINAYFSNIDPADNIVNADYDAVSEFMDCTGYFFRGTTTTEWSKFENPHTNYPGWKSHAYGWFYYDGSTTTLCAQELGYVGAGSSMVQHWVLIE